MFNNNVDLEDKDKMFVLQAAGSAILIKCWCIFHLLQMQKDIIPATSQVEILVHRIIANIEDETLAWGDLPINVGIPDTKGGVVIWQNDDYPAGCKRVKTVTSCLKTD